MTKNKETIVTSKEKMGWRSRILRGLGVTAGAAAIFMGTAHAAEAAPVEQSHTAVSIDNDQHTRTVFAAGRQDNPDARREQLATYIGATPDNVEHVQFTKKIFPLDTERMDSSVAGGVRNGDNMLGNTNGQGEVIAGYSEGSVVATELAAKRPEATLVTVGGPGTLGTGIAHNALVQAVDPVLEGALGIDLDSSKVPDRPGEVIQYASIGDVYASGNTPGLNAVGIGDQILDTVRGDAHTSAYNDDAREHPLDVVQQGNTTAVTVKDNGISGYGEVARQQGLQWSPEANTLANLAGGFNADRTAVTGVNPEKIADAAANLAESTARGYGIDITLPGHVNK